MAAPGGRHRVDDRPKFRLRIRFVRISADIDRIWTNRAPLKSGDSQLFNGEGLVSIRPISAEIWRRESRAFGREAEPPQGTQLPNLGQNRGVVHEWHMARCHEAKRTSKMNSAPRETAIPHLSGVDDRCIPPQPLA